jgi:ABC-type sugar transport system ATPase subunit
MRGARRKRGGTDPPIRAQRQIRSNRGMTGWGSPRRAISVRGLGKRFGDRVAFDDVSFDVGYGEVFGFLGPNGAGKTTTVRTLGTLLAASSGSAEVAGLPSKPENGVEIRRRIAIMPESPDLYLRLSVGENLRCFADLSEVPDPSGRIDQVLRAVNLVRRMRGRLRHVVQGPAAAVPLSAAARSQVMHVARRGDSGRWNVNRSVPKGPGSPSAGGSWGDAAGG